MGLLDNLYANLSAGDGHMRAGLISAYQNLGNDYETPLGLLGDALIGYSAGRMNWDAELEERKREREEAELRIEKLRREVAAEESRSAGIDALLNPPPRRLEGPPGTPNALSGPEPLLTPEEQRQLAALEAVSPAQADRFLAEAFAAPDPTKPRTQAMMIRTEEQARQMGVPWNGTGYELKYIQDPQTGGITTVGFEPLPGTPSETDKAVAAYFNSQLPDQGQQQQYLFGPEADQEYFKKSIVPTIQETRARIPELRSQRDLYKRMQLALESGADTGPGAEITQQVRSALRTWAPGLFDAMGEEQLATMGATDLFQAASSYLIPRLRVAGSGPQSDRDIALLAQAAPNMARTPEGNKILARAELARLNREIEIAEFTNRWLHKNWQTGGGLAGLDEAIREKFDSQPLDLGMPRISSREELDELETGAWYIDEMNGQITQKAPERVVPYTPGGGGTTGGAGAGDVDLSGPTAAQADLWDRFNELTAIPARDRTPEQRAELNRIMDELDRE